MDLSKLSAPSVHLNGTSKGDLARDLQRAIDPLCDAIKYLRIGGPYERDYYPQGREAYLKARAEHDARVASLTAVLEELEYLALKIDEQE